MQTAVSEASETGFCTYVQSSLVRARATTITSPCWFFWYVPGTSLQRFHIKPTTGSVLNVSVTSLNTPSHYHLPQQIQIHFHSHIHPTYLFIYMYGKTNQNSIKEEIKCRLKAGNSCYYSLQKLLPSQVLSENLKI